MKKKNGFTLVELLAVIVVLAIIMILAIPAVLNVMDNARRQSFVIAIDKYVTAVQQQFMSDSSFGDAKTAGVYVYNITTDLGLSSTGSNQGYVIVDARDSSNVQYYITMHDNNFQITHYNITQNKMPDSTSSSIQSFGGWNISNEYYACQDVIQNPSIQCYNNKGYVWTQG